MTVQPEPPLRPGEEQGWGVAIHLGRFLLGGFGFSLIVPLVIWLVLRRRSALINDHGRSALNWELTLILVGVLGIGAAVGLFATAAITGAAGGDGPMVGFMAGYGLFWLGALALFVLNLVLSIIGAVRAYQRRRFRYWAIPFIR
ncbi:MULTISPECIES: DUF4870 domain-containing protein [Nesterenkonia]|uniref:DUF4870 domain-containing protein n=1 Tax=Nesterenkonia TaxID=57494 RepID=UPI0011B5F813|nr:MULTISPECIES: DUF4870 domain-containing protein [Nesterenkonia]